MRRHELINWFVGEYGYKSYLEIGVDNPSNCFDHIQCPRKVGVDPNKPTTYMMTSDLFFSINTEMFDIVFIDGLHIREQVIKDVDNALIFLNENGTIIMHDCHPYSEIVASPVKLRDGSWYGNVWQGFAHFRKTRADLTMHVWNDDCGCGIIQRGSQELYTGPIDGWDDYKDKQEEILRLIDIHQVKQIFGRNSNA